jgi:hypothetical protein
MRRVPSLLTGFGMMCAAVALLIVAILSLAAANAPQAGTGADKAAATATLPTDWIDIVRPIPVYDLSAPELAKSPLHYAARRDATGATRQDILTLGTPAESPYVRLVLTRLTGQSPANPPLSVDLAQGAADADFSIVRSRAPIAFPTRFGGFEESDVALAAKTGKTLSCLGFRGAALAGTFRISGFACGLGTEPMAQVELTCLIERLDLNEAGDDQALSGFFAASELRRDSDCAGNELRPTAAPASWLDRNDAPQPLAAKKLL